MISLLLKKRRNIRTDITTNIWILKFWVFAQINNLPKIILIVSRLKTIDLFISRLFLNPFPSHKGDISFMEIPYFINTVKF